jgi:HrpA-like RNA helicase
LLQDSKEEKDGNKKGELEYKTIIIDEAHERNKNIDQLMAFCKDLVMKSNKKLVLMSATIDLPFYEKYFSSFSQPLLPGNKEEKKGAKVGKIEISGRSFPVEHIFLESESDYVNQAVKLIVADIFPPGDILIFLNASSELRKACKEIHAKTKFACYELHKGTNTEMREEIMSENAYKEKFKGAPRKVIFSTNIAESGITIDGVKVVIDSGQRYESVFSPKDEMHEMAKTFISKAEAQQRAGRAGRTAPGTCYHLYSEKVYNSMPDFKAPEMEKEEISDMLLALFNSGITIDFLQKLPTPPSKHQIDFGLRLLTTAGLISSSSSSSSFSHDEKGNEKGNEKGSEKGIGKITELGREVAKIPLNWQESICLLKAKFLRVENSVCKILAMMSVEPVIENWFSNVPENSPKYKEFRSKLGQWENAAGDIFALKVMFEKFLDAGNSGFEWCNKNYLQGTKFLQAKKTFYKLLGKTKDFNNISFWRDQESQISENEKKKITLALEEGFKLNIATRITGNRYSIERPCKEVKIDKNIFIKKVGKRILFLSVKKIQGTVKVSSIVNLSSKKLSS